MDLTRYWRAQRNGSNIEVQWTGFRFQGGWTLRLLVNGELKAERKVRRFVRNFEVRHPPRSGWLDGLGRLKGGWAKGLGVARCAPY